MKRQCAWCLRLMDNDGEHLSPAPLPKLYDATHGMCAVCGKRWMEQVMRTQDTNNMYMRSGIAESVEHSFTEHPVTVSIC